MKINLLPVDQRPLRQGTIRWEFLIVVLGLVLIVVINGFGYAQKLRLESLKQEYQSLNNNGMLLKSQAAAVRDLEALEAQLNEQIEYYQQIFEHPTNTWFTENLTVLTEHTPNKLWIEEFEAGYNHVSVSGYTLDSDLVPYVLEGFTQRGLEAWTSDVINNSLTSFIIEAQRR